MSAPPAARLCPLSPSLHVDEGEGWDNLEDAEIPAELDTKSHDLEAEDDVDADDGTETQAAIGMPEPPQPSREEVARHNLTHAKYRPWCPHCVFGRRNNSVHSSHSSTRRSVPLFCADYCFVRDVDDEDNLTCLVGRLFPNRALFASACDQKGADDEVVSRLAAFFKSAGIPKLVYKTDQESALRSTIEEALKSVGRSGRFESFEAVPEASAVGESASNGKAERSVQAFEDLLRTLKSALETRLQTKLPVKHPVIRWLVEHVASIMNRFMVNPDGVTPYQAMHGKRAALKVVEFGERVFYYVPKRLRAKLSRRWRLGVYLGMAPSSNEHYVSTSQGNVVKARSICRVAEKSRWSSADVLKIVGTPSLMCPAGDEDIGPAVEEGPAPHAELDQEVREELAAEVEEDDVQMGKSKNQFSGKITEKDLKRYGYTDGCQRCRDLQRGIRLPFKPHTDECRLRMYFEWEKADDPKYKKVKHILHPDAAAPDAAEPGDLDLDALDLEAPPVVDAPPAPPTPAGPQPPSQPHSPSGIWDPEQNDFEYFADKLDGAQPLHEVVPPDFLDDAMEEDPPAPDPSAPDGNDMVDYLVMTGADPVEARQRVNAMLGQSPTK